MRRLLWLFPPSWRRRYGDELLELLADSDRPLADALDVIRAAAAAWRDRPSTMIAGIASAALGAVLTAWAAGELAGGVAELYQHWWSALAALPLIAGLALLALAAHGRRVLAE